MTTYFSIDKKELDFDPNIKSQLRVLSQQMHDSHEKYHFFPSKKYKETFLWVLETNLIPYELKMIDFTERDFRKAPEIKKLIIE